MCLRPLSLSGEKMIIMTDFIIRKIWWFGKKVVLLHRIKTK